MSRNFLAAASLAGNTSSRSNFKRDDRLSSFVIAELQQDFRNVIKFLRFQKTFLLKCSHLQYLDMQGRICICTWHLGSRFAEHLFQVVHSLLQRHPACPLLRGCTAGRTATFFCSAIRLVQSCVRVERWEIFSDARFRL